MASDAELLSGWYGDVHTAKYAQNLLRWTLIPYNSGYIPWISQKIHRTRLRRCTSSIFGLIATKCRLSTRILFSVILLSNKLHFSKLHESLTGIELSHNPRYMIKVVHILYPGEEIIKLHKHAIAAMDSFVLVEKLYKIWLQALEAQKLTLKPVNQESSYARCIYGRVHSQFHMNFNHSP